MTDVDDLAKEIKRRNRSGLLPEGDTASLVRLYALLAPIKGRSVDPEDVHNAWAVWILDKDLKHRYLRPSGDLDVETQATNTPYVEAAQAVAAEHLDRATS